MSSLQKHINRVNALSKKLQPNPTVIDCSGARDELLAMLESQMTRQEMHSPVEWTEADRAFIENFDAYLDESIRRIQETHNVKLVSYG